MVESIDKNAIKKAFENAHARKDEIVESLKRTEMQKAESLMGLAKEFRLTSNRSKEWVREIDKLAYGAYGGKKTLISSNASLNNHTYEYLVLPTLFLENYLLNYDISQNTVPLTEVLKEFSKMINGSSNWMRKKFLLETLIPVAKELGIGKQLNCLLEGGRNQQSLG